MRYLVKVDDLDIERILRVDVDVRLTKNQVRVREAFLRNGCNYTKAGKELGTAHSNVHKSIKRILSKYKKSINKNKPNLFYLWSRKVKVYDLHKIGDFYINNMYTQQEVAEYFGLALKDLFPKLINMGYQHPVYGGKGNIIDYSFVKRYFELQGYELLSKKYIDARSQLNFICPNGHKHHINWFNFYTNGARCGKCPQRGGNYNETIAERHKEEFQSTPAVVYKIRLHDNTEAFYKIGISIDFHNRKYSFPYNVEVVELEETNLYDAIYREKELHVLHDKYKYVPHKHFGGHFECFSKLI